MAARRLAVLLGVATAAILTVVSATAASNAVSEAAAPADASDAGASGLAKVASVRMSHAADASEASPNAVASGTMMASLSPRQESKAEEVHLEKVVDRAGKVGGTTRVAEEPKAAGSGGELSLKAGSSARIFDEASVDAITRQVVASSPRDAVIKVSRRLAQAYFQGSQVQYKFHGNGR